MATKSIAWNTGSGNINVEYGGNKDGTIVVTSDNNNLYESRSQQITVRTTDGSNIERTITIQQAAKVRIDISTAIVTAANQTYSGSAKTPTPTVTLDGSTVPSSGYDVSYSSNTNPGTATITIIGKGNYTGVATGYFTINKASRTVSFYSPVTSLGKMRVVTNAASVSAGGSDGTLSYSSSDTSVATVDSSGIVTGLSGGSVTITASISEGDYYLSASGTYTITVSATPPNGTYIENNSGILYTSDEWGSGTGTAKCVVLITNSYKLRIEYVSSSIENMGSSDTVSSNITSCTSTTYGYPNCEILNSLVSRTILSGSSYLPAYEEMMTVNSYVSSINECAAKCGKSTLNTTGIFWTSTYWGKNANGYHCLKVSSNNSSSNGKGSMLKTNARLWIRVSQYS